MPKKQTSVRTEISARAGARAPTPAAAPPPGEGVGVGSPTVAGASMPDAEAAVAPQARGGTPAAHATPMPDYPHGRGGTGIVPMPPATARSEAPAAVAAGVRDRPAAQPMPHD